MPRVCLKIETLEIDLLTLKTVYYPLSSLLLLFRQTSLVPGRSPWTTTTLRKCIL